MAQNNTVLLIGGLHFVRKEWEDLRNHAGVSALKVYTPLTRVDRIITNISST